MTKKRGECNPNWDLRLERTPAEVAGVMVVHIPNLDDYYTDMLEVLDRSLSSWVDPQMERIVYLNGCCDEVKDLVRSHEPDMILESSYNVGAINALFQAVRFAQSEIIAYSDYDVLYKPGWLAPQLEILHNFPAAGMVSGNAAGWSAEHCNKSAKGLPGKWKDQDLEALRQWAKSIKRRWEGVKERAKREKQWHTGSKIPAVVGAKHFQFIAYRSRLLEIDPGFWPHAMRGHVKCLDEAMDEAGYQRLSVPVPVCWHMGNTLDNV